MPRAIWSGSVSFGLVNIPVKLVTAVRKHDVRFHQLHATDGSRIELRRVCRQEGAEVAYEDLAKGYELSPGRYVMIEPEELDALDPPASRSIDIEAFVSLDEIDPLYYDSSYFLVPDELGERPYRLLADAMSESRRVALGRFVMRTRQYMCALRPMEGALSLATMNFPDELLAREELELPAMATPPTEAELVMAGQLIDTLTAPFEPARYHDTYRERVMDLIERKAGGMDVVVETGDDAAPAPVIDMMEALEASLERAKAARQDQVAEGTS